LQSIPKYVLNVSSQRSSRNAKDILKQDQSSKGVPLQTVGVTVEFLRTSQKTKIQSFGA